MSVGLVDGARDVVGRPRGILRIVGNLDGELINATRADGRGRLGTQQESLWQSLDVLLIFVYAIVETWHIHHLCKTAVERLLGVVHALSNGAGRVEMVAEALQADGDEATFGRALLGNLVANAPHHDAGVVAISQNQVGDILLGPLVEEAGVAVLALGVKPHVEALGHHHHTQRVADVHLHLRRHVVRGADGIAPHGLHRLDLADKGRLVDGGAQRAEVVM